MKFIFFAPKWSPWPVWEPSWGLLARTCGLLERTWTDFGAQDVPKGTPKGTQEAPQKSPKCNQFSSRFSDRLENDFRGPKGAQTQGGKLLP